MSISGSIGLGERTLFLGTRVPPHIKNLAKTLPTINKSTFRSLLKLALCDLEGKEISVDAYKSIKDGCTDNSNVDSIYSAIYSILRSALRFPEASLKQEVFKEDLQDLKIPEEYVADLANIVYGPRRSLIDKNAIKVAPQIPHLETLRWRVDVTISTSALSRVLEPTLLMEVKTNDGKKETFEAHISQFHQLRFAVASLLKEMELLEKKNIVKMQI